MKHKKLIVRHGVLAALFLGMLAPGRAQETASAKPVTIDSFSVVRDYKPLLADAVKIRRSPDMTNKRSYMPKLSYDSVPDKKLDINTGLKELQVRETPFSTLAGQTSNYLKFGMGNFSTVLGEGYFSYDAYQDMRIGGFAKHLSQKGPLDDQEFARQEIGFFTRRVFPTVTLDGTVGYNRYASKFYARPTIADTSGSVSWLDPAPGNPLSFEEVYFSGELTGNADPKNGGAFSYSAKADAYHFRNKRDSKETSFALSVYMDSRTDNFHIGANLSLDLNTVSGTESAVSGRTNNSMAVLNPYIRLAAARYRLTLGANLVPEIGDSTSFNIFPSAEIDFALLREYLHLFGGVTGTVQKASYRDFARSNPFLGDARPRIQNMTERLHVHGGVKGNSGALFGYKVKAVYRQLEGLPLFVNNLAEPWSFLIAYDGDGEKAAKHIGLEGELNMRVSQTVNIGGRLNIDEYTTAQATEAWHMPNMRLTANARFNLSDRLYIDAEALFQSSSYALEHWIPSSGTPIGPYRKEVPSFFDLSAGAEFKATDRLGVFAKANNIFNREYQTYLYYPKLGLNLIGGLNFSF